ncbi:MAG: YgfZ/GcvT domain-containing protein [Longimicrobiales bacterium]
MNQAQSEIRVRRGELYGADVVRSYGDAAGEYAALRDGAGMVVREDRRIVRVHGRDPMKMVHGLVTNDVLNLADGQAVYAALLTPKGRMIGEMRVVRHSADLLIDVDVAALEGVLAHLKKFVPPLFARFEDASAQFALVGAYGAHARAAVAAVCGAPDRELVEDEAVPGAFAGGAMHVIGTHYTGGEGYDVVVPAEDADGLQAALVAHGVQQCGHAALDVLRIEAGRPRWGAELDDATIPLEAGLKERAISTSKGCYTGQEVIIRILHRGHVNWQLHGLRLGDAAVPARGATLTQPDTEKTVARVTSACVSPRFDETIALAYVRREIAPGTDLVIAGTAQRARVVTLPFTD